MKIKSFWNDLQKKHHNDINIIHLSYLAIISYESLEYKNIFALESFYRSLKSQKSKYTKDFLDPIKEQIDILHDLEEETTNTEFSHFIMYTREKKNITLTALSEKTGVSTSYLSRIESGDRNPPNIRIVYALSVALDLPFTVLLDKLGVPIDKYESEHEYFDS